MIEVFAVYIRSCAESQIKYIILLLSLYAPMGEYTEIPVRRLTVCALVSVFDDANSFF